ncbi:MAG: beta-ketoacyl-ACP synthase III [Actinomycetota bacterium]|nr:beta-ketoacyl-ACP synthase III [Actinomycetota bacterium]
MDNVTISACGKYVPPHVLHNRELEDILDTSHAWIKERTGIEERRVAGPDEDNLNLSLRACRDALSRAGRRGEDIDLIIVATTTADRMCPAIACSLQKELGAKGPALDISAGCSGFVYGLIVALHLMRGGMAKRAAVVGTETMTRIVDWRDRSTCVLFGDGAGVALLDQCLSGEGMLSACLGAWGEGDRHIHAAGGGACMMASLGGGLDGRNGKLKSLLPFLDDRWSGIYPFVRMDGKEVFRFAVGKLSGIVEDLSAEVGVVPEDVKLIVPHQANNRIIEATARKLRLPVERFFMNIERYGNTSAASIPIAMDEALSMGRIETGDLVILAGFGAGLTWGGVLLRWADEARSRMEKEGEKPMEVKSAR